MMPSTQFNRAASSRHRSMLEWVEKPKRRILPSAFCSAAHSRMPLSMISASSDPVDEEEVDMIGVHFFQGSGQVLAHAPTRSGRGFGDQEDLLPVFGVAFEVLADACFASPAAVNMGRVPIGDAPAYGLLEQGLVGRDVEHAPQGQDGYLNAGSAEGAGGHGGDVGRFSRRGCLGCGQPHQGRQCGPQSGGRRRI